MATEFAEDTKLIQQSMAKAGRYIHDVSNVVCVYRNAVLLANSNSKKKDEWIKVADKTEKKLRIFVATGKIEKV